MLKAQSRIAAECARSYGMASSALPAVEACAPARDNSRMRYPILFFDADNTLFDFDAAQSIAFEQAMRQVTGDFEPQFLSVYERINKQYWQAFERGEVTQTQLKEQRFQSLFEEVEATGDPGEMNSVYMLKLSQCTLLLDGALELIEQLAGHHRMLLITNGLKNVQRPRFSASPITQHFEDIVISDELGIAKPHAGIFDESFARMGNPPKSDVLIIGDSLSSDMQGGIDYGIDTCWFNPHGKTNTSLPVTHVIQTLDDLHDIVS